MFSSSINPDEQRLQFFNAGKKDSTESVKKSKPQETQSDQDDYDMHFFGDIRSSQGDLKSLLKDFERTNKTTNIFATTDEQLERLYDLYIDILMKENPTIGQMPKSFLKEHFLKFSKEQVDEVKQLIRRFATINKTDDYRKFTTEQQLEAKALVEKMIKKNLSNFIKSQTTHSDEVPTMREYQDHVSQFRDVTVKFEEYLSNQESAILDIVSNITQKYTEMIRPFAEKSAEALVIRQGAQILSLSNDISLLQSQYAAVVSELTRLKEKNTAALQEMTHLNDQKTAAVDEVNKLRQKNATALSEMNKLKAQNESILVEMNRLKDLNTSALNEMNRLREQNESAQNEMSRLKEQNSSNLDKLSEISKLQEELETEKKKNADLQERFAMLRNLFSPESK